jgi:hypothetical protein
LRGIKIDRSAELKNAFDSIRVNRESDSNETDSSDLHQKKHRKQRISTSRGIKIDRSEESENACDSIRLNRDSTSNETDSSDRHEEKQNEQRISISHGMITDDELERLRINL